MAQPIIRALLIEDNPADALLVQDALEKDPLASFELVIAERLSHGMARLQEQHFDVLLLDLGLPDSQGLATFEQVYRRSTRAPVVVLSGLMDEQVAVQAVQNGAQDYLVKGQAGWEGLARAIRYAIERQQVQEQLLYQASLLQNVSDAIIATDLSFTITSWNQAAEALYGWSAAEALGQPISELLRNAYADMQLEQVLQQFWTQGAWKGEVIQNRKDGSAITVLASVSLLKDRAGNPVGVVAVNRDITERKRAEEQRSKLEAQLRHAQKMESVGRLAGGVAHDFNNLLTVIQGYCSLIQEQISRDDPLREDVEQIQLASQRAAMLTRQLLTFSRKQILSPTVVDLNRLIAQLRVMVERLIGEDITLSTVLQPGLWSVTADASQLEQVFMNLVVNARDAMPTGGMLTIETRNVQLDDDDDHMPIGAPGRPCVMVVITDTGHGMDDHVRSHLFEPFFTTKERGQGTGLGLATVYGIVKQSGGSITVYSEPGVGTSFRIYLPVSEAVAADLVPVPNNAVARGGHETILLVEDEEHVRQLVRAALEQKGYTVLEACHGGEALLLAAQHQGAIDILVTDVVMPQLSGRLLAEQLKALRPTLKILFMSGYTDDTVIRHGLLTAEVEFLAKPFSLQMLTAKVREVLDK